MGSSAICEPSEDSTHQPAPRFIYLIEGKSSVGETKWYAALATVACCARKSASNVVVVSVLLLFQKKICYLTMSQCYQLLLLHVPNGHLLISWIR